MSAQGLLEEIEQGDYTMADIPEALRKRAQELVGSTIGFAKAAEAEQFATTMLTMLYGDNSPQLRQYRDGCDAITKLQIKSGGGRDHPIWVHSLGTIRNALAELDAGLIVNVRASITGEILAELVGLAKEILTEQSESAKNVGAVLVAAAYEDLLRRMGEQFAGIAGRPSLQDIVIALKSAGVLNGAEIGVAQSFLQFRNDSLHADWQKISRTLVESCLAFVENMLVKHFSKS